MMPLVFLAYGLLAAAVLWYLNANRNGNTDVLAWATFVILGMGALAEWAYITVVTAAH